MSISNSASFMVIEDEQSLGSDPLEGENMAEDIHIPEILLYQPGGEGHGNFAEDPLELDQPQELAHEKIENLPQVIIGNIFRQKSMTFEEINVRERGERRAFDIIK